MSNARELAELGGSYGTGGFVGMKNRLINPAMVIDQRNAGGVVTPGAAALTYIIDRWGFFNSTANNRFNAQRNAGTVTPPSGFKNYLGFTVTSAYTPSGADQQTTSQQIEGFNISDLDWGTANAQTVTLSFWVRSSLTGTHSGALRNPNGYTRSYPFSFTISLANTWEYKTITIAGDTGGSWNSDNSAGVQVAFNLGSGSSSLGTAGAWNTTNAYTGATGSVQVSATNSATFYITGVQLEKGSTATSFDYRPYGTELALCQRYYQQAMSGFAITSLTTQTDVTCTFPLKVEMRADPTAGAATIPAGMAFHRPGIAFYSVTAINGVPDKSGQGYSSVTIATGAATSTSGQITSGPWLTAEL
jgi:hypothetical protein